jgi:DNA polymerase III epsilon subunit-like protein
MSAQYVLVFDTETTGLTLHPGAPLDKQPRIIELGAALVDRSGQVVETLSQLVHPRQEISAEITKITGLTNDDLVGAPNFEACLPQLRHIFGQAFAVVAHNLPFDKALVRYELQRGTVLDFPWPAAEYCTVGLHRPAWGRNPKLTELYENTLGRPLPQTHRALDDVLALVEVVVALGLHELAYEERADVVGAPA